MVSIKFIVCLIIKELHKMKLKTKFAHHFRNRRVASRVFIVTNYTNSKFVEAGKQYRVIRTYLDGFMDVWHDKFGKMLCCPVGMSCAYLNKKGVWSYSDKQGVSHD